MTSYKCFINSLFKVTFETLRRKFLFCSHSNINKVFQNRQFSNIEKSFSVNNLKPWKVVFYGSDEISEVALKALNANRLSSFPQKIIEELDVVCVQSSCPVRKYANLNNLTIHTWPYSIPNGAYDIGVVVSFGHMIPAECIEACKLGMINAHPSLLPRWRGAAPIFYAILSGDTETGVTITQVSPNKFDVGKILLQETFRIPDGYTSKQLAKDLSEIAAVMVMKTLKNLPEYLELSYSQPKDGKTLARKINPQKCSINWEEDTMSVIERKLRAFEGYFNVFTFWKDMKVVILKCLDPKEANSANISSLISYTVSPGYCYFHKRRKVLFVKCKDGWCGVTALKIPKTGEVSSLSFYNGFISKENPKNCYFISLKNKESK